MSLDISTGAPLRTGGTIPLLGFGTWQLRGDECLRAVSDALDLGYRHLDTATMYGNEQQVGRAIRDSGIPREDIFVTTKLPPDRADRARHTLQQSLDALGLDRVDLWLIHWPPRSSASSQTWQALLDAQRDGLATAVGVSNYSTAQIDELISATGEAPAVNQIEWGPNLYDAARAEQLQERDVVLEGYSPFKSSNLDDKRLTDITDAHGKSTTQVVVRWHLQHGVVVIPKSSRRERIEANADVFDFELSDDEMRELDALGG